ncbi:MAG: PAS domain S-box protein [Smithella sp.]
MTMAVKLEAVNKSEKNNSQQSDLSHLADAIIATAGVGIYILRQGKFVYVSHLYQNLTGYSETELIGTYYLGNVYPDDRKMVREEAIKRLKAERFEPYEYRLVNKKDEVMWVLEMITPIVYREARATLGSFMDITERKKTEEKLRQEERKFRALAEQSSDIIVLVNRKGIITYENGVTERILGFKFEEIIGAGLFDLVHPADLTFLMDLATTLARDKNAPGLQSEVRLRHRNGSWRMFEVTGSSIINNTKIEGGIVNLHYIAKHKQMEKALHQSEEKYRTILENIQEGYFEVDLAGNLTFFNDSMCRLCGYSKEELAGMNYQQFTNKETSKKLFQMFNNIYNTGEPVKGFDWQIIRKDGTKRCIEASASLQKYLPDKPIGFRGLIRDITESKRTERILRENEERLRGITQNLPGIIFQFYAKDSGEYGLSYVSERLSEYSKIVPNLDMANLDTMFPLLVSHIHEEDRDRFLTSIKVAVETETSWKFEGRIFIQPGTMIWIHGLSTPTRHEDRLVFDGILMSVTERKQAEMELQKTLESLWRAVGTTIQVLISALESRDPYTAGHQKRVADLARAIATEMEFPYDIIEGIHMAGSIHDIGKLSIPSEILSKPTKLTNIEFSLIKEHSQSGYEMLKDVESPWPLAQIVYQHHERMNGTGYPRNLKGDEIIMEARIMAVADVVESMASHRPYRAALGIDAALEEITKNKGILYDNNVVDACLKLFREKGYELK